MHPGTLQNNYSNCASAKAATKVFFLHHPNLPTLNIGFLPTTSAGVRSEQSDCYPFRIWRLPISIGSSNGGWIKAVQWIRANIKKRRMSFELKFFIVLNTIYLIEFWVLKQRVKVTFKIKIVFSHKKKLQKAAFHSFWKGWKVKFF